MRGLPPIARGDARVLILGSFPSERSLRQRQYYAHPRNQFWDIIGRLFGRARENSYATRRRQLMQCKIAVWDVLAGCQRCGSLDRAIRAPRANDFARFYRAHPEVDALFWNGAAAQRYYQKLVAPKLRGAPPAGRRLPSTSPAYASRSLADKTAQWRAVKNAAATG